jgi:hypothetical protein
LRDTHRRGTPRSGEGRTSLTNPETVTAGDHRPAITNDPYGVFAGKINVPLLAGLRAIGISRSKGYRLIDDGVLERRKVGRAAYLTVASLLRVAAGVPPAAKKPIHFQRGDKANA